MKRIIFISLIIFTVFNLSIAAQQNKNINELIKKSQTSDVLKNAQWSLYAKYVESGETVIDYNSQFSLAPASGLKLVSTAAAFYFLGEEFQFETKVFYDGEIENEILRGNLYLVGAGDPTLGSDRVQGSKNLQKLFAEWSARIKELGIKKIEGSVIADDLHFDRIPIPGEWIWTDIGNYYGASCSALTLAENTYKLYFKPGKKVGDLTEVIRTEPEIKNLKFNNFVLTGAENSGDNGYIFRAPGQYNAVLRGTIPAGVDEFSIKGSIPNPALFAAEIFTKYLNSNGIEVSKNAEIISSQKKYEESKFIVSAKSPKLKDLIFHLNKRSINLYTEQLVKEIGFKVFNEGSTEKGIEAIKRFLDEISVDTEGFQLYDGSGLSRSNTITTKLMAEMLAGITKQKFYDSYYNSLAVAGDPNDLGFFKSFGKGTKIENNARIKSGLINRVRSHSGYVKDSKGKLIVYSFIANNINGSHRMVDKIHKKLLIELAQ